ncbi:MAG: hypothetical protein AAF628_23720 [Planctomycetota bacterium]
MSSVRALTSWALVSILSACATGVPTTAWQVRPTHLRAFADPQPTRQDPPATGAPATSAPTTEVPETPTSSPEVQVAPASWLIGGATRDDQAPEEMAVYAEVMDDAAQPAPEVIGLILMRDHNVVAQRWETATRAPADPPLPGRVRYEATISAASLPAGDYHVAVARRAGDVTLVFYAPDQSITVDDQVTHTANEYFTLHVGAALVNPFELEERAGSPPTIVLQDESDSESNF